MMRGAIDMPIRIRIKYVMISKDYFDATKN
jgi:hypothetical protein